MKAGRKPGAINLGKWFLVPRDGDDDDFGIVWPPPAEDVEARPLRVSVLLSATPADRSVRPGPLGVRWAQPSPYDLMVRAEALSAR